MNCDALLTAGINPTCAAHPVGYEKRACLINKADIESITISDNVISAITLKSRKTGYLIKQQGKPFNGTKASVVVGDYGNTFTKTAQFVSAEVGAANAKGIYDALLNGEFLLIVENKDKGTNNQAAFEVLGSETGLRIATGEKDAYQQGNRWTFTLQEESCLSSEIFFYSTSYAATVTAFEALLPSGSLGGGTTPSV